MRGFRAHGKPVRLVITLDENDDFEGVVERVDSQGRVIRSAVTIAQHWAETPNKVIESLVSELWG
jgi:hypothetical protein